MTDQGEDWPTTFPAKLGAIRCATITCASLTSATDAYAEALGFVVVESGTVSPDLAAHWRASACAGAKFLLMQQPGTTGTYLRFVEDPEVIVPIPYTTLGWAAIEFSVNSSDATVAAAERSGFRVVGAAQELTFSAGALRAGQVAGAFGEILYFTEVRSQLADYTLPVATIPIGPMFIVIAAVPTVAAAYDDYARRFGMTAKNAFDAEVPFIAAFQKRPLDTSFHVGCLELVPESYVEVDEMGPGLPRRSRPDGRLPAGIAMISFASEFELFGPSDVAGATCPTGLLYAGRQSIVVAGLYGELIEIIAAPSASGA